MAWPIRLMRAKLALFWLLVISPSALAVDGAALELGVSSSTNASVELARIGIQWNWAKRWSLGSDWHVGGYWDLSVGYWSNESPGRTEGSLADVGVTPTFVLEQTHPGAVAPYLEAGIGLRLLSETSVGSHRQLGTHFQFGDHLGLGIRFGLRRAFGLGYRFQHISNAGLKQPNQGLDFHQLRFQYHF